MTLEEEKAGRQRRERCTVNEEVKQREREREGRDGGRCRKDEGVCSRETGCLDGVECVLLCGRLSDCNDCSKVTGLISGRAAQSGTITVQILWMKSERLRSSLCA